ncbi:MAG TPA: hypothetical protein VIL97_00535, partial [Thermoanaerobaculia bacterium]
MSHECDGGAGIGGFVVMDLVVRCKRRTPVDQGTHTSQPIARDVDQDVHRHSVYQHAPVSIQLDANAPE